MKEIEVMYEISFNSSKDDETKTIVFEMTKKLEKWMDKTFCNTIQVDAEARDNGWYLIVKPFGDNEELMKKRFAAFEKTLVASMYVTTESGNLRQAGSVSCLPTNKTIRSNGENPTTE